MPRQQNIVYNYCVKDEKLDSDIARLTPGLRFLLDVVLVAAGSGGACIKISVVSKF